MNKGIIITLPRHDDVTEYLTAYSNHIIKSANEKSIKIKCLKDKSSTKDDFIRVLSKLDFNLIIFNGHGTKDCIKGHNDEVIIDCDNVNILYNRLIYSRVCDSGKILGKEFICKKEGCFIGYKFRFWADPRYLSSPLDDPTARLFLMPSNQVVISLIKGNNARYSFENSKKMILKNIRKILRKSGKENLLIASDLWNNYEGQVIFGKEDLFI